jgi:hypothetical protein
MPTIADLKIVWIKCSLNLLNHFSVKFLYHVKEIIIIIVDNASLVIQVLEGHDVTLFRVLSFRM